MDRLSWPHYMAAAEGDEALRSELEAMFARATGGKGEVKEY